MDQISPPMRIALAVAVLFAVVWFAALRPKDEPVAATELNAVATPAATATPRSGPGKAVQAAKTAAAADEAASKRRAAATPETTKSLATATPAATQAPAAATATATAAPSPAPTATATAAPDPAALVAKKTGLPRDVAGAIARKQVVVLLFWDRDGTEDRAMRRFVRSLAVRGKVLVHAAPVRRAGDYGAITEGADVQRTPSVVVVDRDLHARLLVGFQSRFTVRQTVADARAGD